jgi:Ca-activated chloride channel homolog
MLESVFSRRLSKLVLGLAVPLVIIPMASAQDAQEEYEDEDDSGVIVVTSSLRQGGAQDISHFRSIALGDDALPRAESLTVEGLLGGHDLTLPAKAACQQLFCLSSASMKASLPGRPDDLLFVGLGFDSNIDAAKWKNEPLSLMAVVDRSGSMDGAPMSHVKAALHQMVEEMNDKDRLGITIYGSDSQVHLIPTSVRGNKAKLHQAINAIEIDGSTNMEEGLRLGYDAAFVEADSFKGKVRMMLFTDEQPNTGDTDPESFMGMALDASKRGIGLTTIGVGAQYDGELAADISSVRGGNLFFLMDDVDAKAVFKREFRNMVSEVAHDVTLSMTPRTGYSVTGVFGVPDALMAKGQDGTIDVTIPTAFLSSNGGGIYVALGKASDQEFLPAENANDGKALMDVSLRYASALDGAMGSDRLTIDGPAPKEPENLRKAHVLVDQYLVMKEATDLYHEDGNAKQAFVMLDALDQRITAADLSGFSQEATLVESLRAKAAFLSGYSGEIPKQAQKHVRPLQVVGEWKVLSATGVEDLYRGDRVEFTDDMEIVTYFKRPRRGESQMEQSFEINESQIRIPDGKLTVNYYIKGDRMEMSTIDGLVKIELRREAETEIVS